MEESTNRETGPARAQRRPTYQIIVEIIWQVFPVQPVGARLRPRRPPRSAADRRRFALFIILAALVPVIAAASVAHRFTFNLTPSLPRGFYRLDLDAAVEKGSTVLLPIPPRVRDLVYARRYLPAGARLLKTVVALPGDRICLDGHMFKVDGRVIAPVHTEDSAGLPLEPYRYCGVVRPGEAYVATPEPHSFDSRYFGPVRLSSLVVARPVWTF